LPIAGEVTPSHGVVFLAMISGDKDALIPCFEKWQQFAFFESENCFHSICSLLLGTISQYHIIDNTAQIIVFETNSTAGGPFC